jgi:lipoprotein-anchoring transpeptidase ErfK/SrfK
MNQINFHRVITITLATGVFILTAIAAAMMPPAASAAQIVRVVAPTVARENPGFGPVVKRLGTTTPYGNDQLALRVFRSVPGEVDPVTGIQRTYYLVHLPYRSAAHNTSNGNVGWVASDHVQLFTSPYTVVINRAKRQLTVKKNGHRWHRWRVVVGAASTPTPNGEFAVMGKTTRDHGFDGTGLMPFAYSNVLDQFDGSNGKVAMHGRSGASFNDPLGTARSHGCVRMDNANMEILLARLPIGTPVTVI